MHENSRETASDAPEAPRDKRFTARDSAVRKEAARAVGERREAAATPDLLRLLHDRSTGVAATALWALGRIGDPGTVESIAALLRAPAATLRTGAVRALAALRTPAAAAALIDALPEGDEALVAAVLTALKPYPDDAVVEKLVALLHDTRGQVRARAGRALLQRTEAASRALVAVLDHDAGETDFRRAAAHVVAAGASDATLDALLALSQDADIRTRLYATRGLGALVALPKAHARLEELRDDERRDIAGAASEALARREPSGAPAAPTSSQALLSQENLELPAGLTYLAMTAPGLEDVVAGSIGAFGKSRVLRSYPGALQLMLDAPSSAFDALRTLYDVLLFAGLVQRSAADGQKPAFHDTRLLRTALNALAAAQPDAARTLYVGVPRDTPPGEAKRLRAAVEADLGKLGWRLAAPGETAAYSAEVVMLDGRALLGVRVRERAPGGATGALAAAMVLLTEPDSDDVFLDPLCGSTGGALLRERAAFAPYAMLVGVDNGQRALDKVREMLADLPDVSLHRRPATAPGLGPATVDAAVALLRGPGLPEDAEVFYTTALAALASVVRPGGRVVVGVAEARLMTSVLRAERSFARTSSNILTVEAGSGPVALFVLRRREV